MILVNREILKKQHYVMLGQHSATKLCHWVREKLINKRPCYKETFYGIQCHRCMQIAPCVSNCTQSCLFCWRYREGTSTEPINVDDPVDMIDRAIEAQRKLVSGFKGDERCDLGMWEEAREPKHVAISLSGEPTLYERLPDLIEYCRKINLTTFLVTNGTLPKVLQDLDPLPDQLYVTLAAPNEEVHKRLCVPLKKEDWSNLMETLRILPSLDTRKVIRHTLVRGWNMCNVKNYGKLDKMADPDFIEAKAYMFVGYSRQIMNLDNMPSHKEILDFSSKLSDTTGYPMIDEKGDSRVALLSSNKKERKLKNEG